MIRAAAVLLAAISIVGCSLLVSTSDLGGKNTSATAMDVPDAGAGGEAGALEEEEDAGVLSDATMKPIKGTVWQGNGHGYEIVVKDAAISWTDARDEAIALGGHLATLTSPGEALFVENILRATPAAIIEEQGPWLGARQPPGPKNEPGGSWEWVTGEPWSFEKWSDGQPDNADGEDFLHYFPSAFGWNDAPREIFLIHSFVVEYE